MYQHYWKLFKNGALLGFRQISLEGFQTAGIKRSLGFFLQPLENWSRYPEIHTVVNELSGIQTNDKVLDLGSPKMIGLLLARELKAKFVLTDIWNVAIKEIAALLNRNRPHLKGEIEPTTTDLTHMPQYKDSSFDWVYSVSVIEHIEDLEKVKNGLKEMERIVTQGGTVVISVPVSKLYRRVYLNGSVYGNTKNDQATFFSHYFDKKTLQDIFGSFSNMNVEKLYYSRWNVQSSILKVWMRVPQKIRGFFGIINMLIAPSVTKVDQIDWQNTEINQDGDFIFVFKKR